MANFKPVKIIKHGKSYQFYYYNHRGERRRLSIGQDSEHVRRIAVRFTDWLLEGKDPELELKKAQQNEEAKTISLHNFFHCLWKDTGA